MKCPYCKKGILKIYGDESMPAFEEALSNYCHENLCRMQILCDKCYKNNSKKIWKFSKLHYKQEHHSVDLV